MFFQGMGFFEDTSIKLNPFIEKMEKGELKLEDILNDENIIQDIKQNAESKFINFLTKDKIQKLIDYSTKFPSEDEHNIGYKYPFNATEILCSENLSFQNNLMAEMQYIPNLRENMAERIKKIKKGSFLNELFITINSLKNGNNIVNGKKGENKENESGNEYESDEDEENGEEKDGKKNEENNIEKTNFNDKKVIYENVDYLLQFLKESDKTQENYVLVGYFYKILSSLINIHQMKIVEYLLDYPRKDEFDVLDLLVKHMKRKSMCNIIQKLLLFDHELISKYDEKKIELLSKIFDELDISDIKDKYECICDCICNVMKNRQFFDLFMTKKELLEKIYKIIFNCKNNDNKYNSILKLLIKINENILQHFPLHYTDNNNENNNDLMQYNYDTFEQSISSPDETELLKKYLFALFDILENDEFKIFEDFGNFEKNKDKNDEFLSTYLEKQKKIGMKNILQTEYLKTIVDIFVNAYASKYHENKIEQLIKIISKQNIFWNLHDLFINFPFSNIFQIYYNQIMKIVLNENSPDSIIEAFFTEENNKKRNIIDFYIDKILSDIKFNFKLTSTKSFNPLLPFIITIINKIYTSQNLYVRSFIDKNKNICAFYEIIGQETENVFNQKLLLSDNDNLGAFGFGDAEDIPLKTFGPQNFMEVFEENCKIFEMYKNGEDYVKALNEKRERNSKEKEKEKEKKDNKMERRGLEYIDDLEDEDDPLFKVEKIKDFKKDDDNFLAILNRPHEEVNPEEDNKDVIIDNIEKDGDNQTEQIESIKELYDGNDEGKERDKNNDEKKVDDNNEKENQEKKDN
jgi:hypothetical protein